MSPVFIAGGGPAGASAAIAAIEHGARVQVVERGRLPRHKVCGEFLSPEIYPLLEKLGVSSAFNDLKPARVRRMMVRIGRREKVSRLPEAAFGVSRYEFDHLLLRHAQARGAKVGTDPVACGIVATGRSALQPRGNRHFGFKAHFEGPVDDAVELFFFEGCYVGINCIEAGRTNVCGLGPESLLAAHDFDIDVTLRRSDAVTRRLTPLRRTMKWLFSGPLEFGNQLRSARTGVYLAGDALSFVDPFTGSGLLSAVATGSLAGEYAASGLSVERYLAACRRLLSSPYELSSVLRRLAQTTWAERLLESVPGRLLYWATRPRVGRLPR